MSIQQALDKSEMLLCGDKKKIKETFEACGIEDVYDSDLGQYLTVILQRMIYTSNKVHYLREALQSIESNIIANVHSALND